MDDNYETFFMNNICMIIENTDICVRMIVESDRKIIM